jgi:hypothetical protein
MTSEYGGNSAVGDDEHPGRHDQVPRGRIFVTNTVTQGRAAWWAIEAVALVYVFLPIGLGTLLASSNDRTTVVRIIGGFDAAGIEAVAYLALDVANNKYGNPCPVR